MKTVNVVYIALIAATYTEAKIHLVSTVDGKNYLVSRTNTTDNSPYRYPFPIINNDYSLPLGDDEYEYVNPEDQQHISNPEGDGDRLVGGRITQSWQYPFVVGWNGQGYTGTSCTGSLITQTYFLTAAHCSGDMTDHDRKNFRKIRNACVEATKSRGSYKLGVKELKCRWLRYKAFEIIVSPPGKAWLGRTDVEKEVDEGQMREIKRIIRHRDTYLGGAGYKRRGGYDICIVELQRPFSSQYQPACLPGPDFQDTNRNDNRLAGFGKYHRSKKDENICQTNRYGQMKYHYCRSEYGEGSNACVTDKPPPMSAECDKFYASPNTPNSPPEDVEEIKLHTRGKSVYCYNKKNPQQPQYGWCYTRGNFYEKGSGTKFNGWGYCSDECYQDENEKNSGVLRSKTKVRVLDERQCNDFLKRSFMYGSVDIRPEILCVGYEFSWREENWKLTSSGYRKVKPISKPVRYGSPTYVTSAGTCNGDSGGPVFVKEGDHFVVTGCTSGGRGPLGSCGGINNPVHYARVKKFTTWIVKNLDREERKNLCWDDDFTQRRQARRNRRG